MSSPTTTTTTTTTKTKKTTNTNVGLVSKREFCPVLKPTWAEFANFQTYIEKIEPIIWDYGIVKIIPPLTFNPRHDRSCHFGPGMFSHVCQCCSSSSSSSSSSLSDQSPDTFYSTSNVSSNNEATNLNRSTNKKEKQHPETPLEDKKTEDDRDECLCKLRELFSDMSLQHMACPIHTSTSPSDCSNNVPPNDTDQDISVHNAIQQFLYTYPEYQLLSQLHENLNGERVYVYYKCDHLWYEGTVMKCDKESSLLWVQMRHDLSLCLLNIFCEIIMVEHYDTTTTAKNNQSQKKVPYCPPLIAHQVKERIDAIRNLDYIDWESIQQHHIDTNTTKEKKKKGNEPHDTEKKKKKTLSKSKLEQTEMSQLHSPNLVKEFCERIGYYHEYAEHMGNHESKPLWDWKIKCPIRQQLQPVSGGESGDRRGVYEAILFARDHEYISVLDYWKQGRVELHSELKEHIGTRQVLKWIDEDKIEENIDEIIRELMRNLAYIKPLYGADTLGSIMHPNQVWNFTKLDSVLNLMDSYIEGVNFPYLYFGRWRTLFSWHIEDKGLYSINMLHFGKPKIWFGVSYYDFAKMENTLQGLYKQEYKKCPVFTRHKQSFVTPRTLERHGVRMCMAVQRAGEIIVTCPKGYHAGFNLGFNCAEAVNFGTPHWIPVGRNAPACQCGLLPGAVHFDVDNITRKILQEFPYLIHQLGSIPPLSERMTRVQRYKWENRSSVLSHCEKSKQKKKKKNCLELPMMQVDISTSSEYNIPHENHILTTDPNSNFNSNSNSNLDLNSKNKNKKKSSKKRTYGQMKNNSSSTNDNENKNVDDDDGDNNKENTNINANKSYDNTNTNDNDDEEKVEGGDSCVPIPLIKTDYAIKRRRKRRRLNYTIVKV